MDFVTGLPQSTDWRSNSYNSILLIINRLTKMVHYKPVQTIIIELALAEVIFNVVVRHHGLFDSIISNRGLKFMSKFWFSLCYFLNIKQRLSTTFQFQTNSQIEQQNSIIKAYLRVFVNYKQDNWTRLLPMAEFAYNNAKHASMGYTPFELNYGYYPCVSHKRDIDPRSRSKEADELTKELKNLMVAYRENSQHTQEL